MFPLSAGWGRVKSLIFFEPAPSFRQNVGTDYCRFMRRFWLPRTDSSVDVQGTGFGGSHVRPEVHAAAHRPLFVIEIAPIIFVADVKMIERSPTPHILALHDLPLPTSRPGRLHRLAELLLADGHLEQ